MTIRRRLFTPLVVLMTAVYLVSSIGCAAARVRPAAQAPSPNAVSFDEAAGRVAPVSYEAASPATGGVLTATPDTVAPQSIGVDQIVRGQDDHGYGPIREFLFSPYTIGAIFLAALIVPAAIEGSEDSPIPVLP